MADLMLSLMYDKVFSFNGFAAAVIYNSTSRQACVWMSESM